MGDMTQTQKPPAITLHKDGFLTRAHCECGWISGGCSARKTAELYGARHLAESHK